LPLLLGIDIGTSGTKTCLYREDGTLAASAFADYPLLQPRSGWAEQHPEDWWEAVKSTIRAILSTDGISPDQIGAVGLSGQMHGLVLLDKEGRVLRPSIIWCDQRTEEEARWINDRIGEDNVIRHTANPALPNFTATRLLWVRSHEPDIHSRIHKVLLPKDYIRYRLTGEFATEVSDASGTLWLDVAARTWSKEMLGHLEVNPEWLPTVYESYEITGRIHARASQDTGLPANTPVVGGGGDQAAGAVGNGIVESGVVSVSLGTSGVVFAMTEELKLDVRGRLHSFCHAVPGKWHVMGVTQAAGGSLQWYRNQFAQQEHAVAASLHKDVYELLSEQAESVEPGSEGLLFLPYLMGERTPHLDSAARGVFFGISARHTRSHFVRAIMEGVSFSQADCLKLLEGLGIPVAEVRASGGGAKSRLWRQMLADIFNRPIVTIQANEGPAFGAALLAGAGIGVYSSVEEACRVTIRATGTQQPLLDNVGRYARFYDLYRKLYPSLKENFRDLQKFIEENRE